MKIGVLTAALQEPALRLDNPKRRVCFDSVAEFLQVRIDGSIFKEG